MSRAELQTFRARAAARVAESYVAVYADSALQLTTVYGFRLEAGGEWPPRGLAAPGAQIQFVGPNIVVAVAGAGSCADALRAHLAGVVRR